MAGVKGKSGRKPLSTLRRITEQIISETSPKAAQYLRDVATGVAKPPDPARIDTCKFIINQDIGAPTQKIKVNEKGKVVFEVVYRDKLKG